MAIRSAWLIVLAACASASTAREPRRALPDAWLVVAVYDDGLQVMRRSFAARDEAEAFLRRAEPEPGDSAPTLAVQKDSPSLRVQIPPLEITAPHHVTLRENWIRRNARWTDSLRPLGLAATVFTWRNETSNDPYVTRRGGKAPPLPCPCGKSSDYVGTLDFRRTPLRTSASIYRCADCKSPAVVWLRAQVAACPVGGQVGTPWDATDYGWDDKTEAAYEERLDRTLAGPTPQLMLTIQGTKVGGYGTLEPPPCACGKTMRFIGRLGDAELFHCCDTKVVHP